VSQAYRTAIHATIIAMNPNPSRSLNIVVLAAGFSTRLGRSKALAQVRGISLLLRTLQLTAAQNSGRTTVVTPPHAARFRLAARGMVVAFAVNSRRAEGLSSSVRCGIRSARHSAAILLLPVDLVNLNPRELGRLIRRWRGLPRRLVARRVGVTGGTPLILPRWLYARALRIGGDVGLRDMLCELPSESRVLIDMPSATMDVDTPRDLEAARRLRRHHG
jgi:molybdenum cofactor cytidylyltransferase